MRETRIVKYQKKTRTQAKEFENCLKKLFESGLYFFCF